MTNQTVGPSAS